MNTHAAKLPNRSFWHRAAAVLTAWLKAPSQVASICPSSRWLLRAVADRECVRQAKTIVDLGPGTGGTSAALLAQAGGDCRLLAIEKTAEFIHSLRAIDDPRLDVELGDAAEMERLLLVHGMTAPDVVVSGIPFSSLPADTARQIMKAVHRNLADGGTLIAYQLRGDVANYAAEFFGPPETVQWVWPNLPPLRIYTWRKSGSTASTTTDHS